MPLQKKTANAVFFFYLNLDVHIYFLRKEKNGLSPVH